MAKEGVDVSFNDPGTEPEALRQAIMQLRADLDRRDFAYMRIINLVASNISIAAGSQDNSVGTIGRDPQSQNIWGFIAERGYGFMARYLRANYARFFVDATNDLNQSTPSSIMDMPSPNKFVFKDNEGYTVYRVYGGHGREVGFPGVDDNYFDGYGGGNNGGALDLFVPMRFMTFDYGGGTSSGPESVGAYSQQGFVYYRQNYGATKICDFRGFDGTSWKSFLTGDPSATAGNPVVADNVTVLEHITVTIS